MSIKGSPYSHFRRALELGDLSLIRLCAAELPRVELADALYICWLMRDDEHAYERATCRWIGRFVLERKVSSLEDVRRVARAFEALRIRPADGVRELRQVCETYGVSPGSLGD